MINWTHSKEEMELQSKIAKRATKMAKQFNVEYDHMTAVMDIDACHSNGCKLKLQELLDADDCNFCHDVFGIRQHINRQTGKLEHCFIPRYAQS